MGMIEYAPDFSLSAEGKDITAAIRRGLIEIRYTDNGAGTKKADELQITLSSETLAIPSKGAVLRLALGFNGVLVDKGSFTVCQVQSSGPPRRLSIYATSAPMNPGKHGSDVTQAKTRAFDDITLADLLKTVASENGLQARVSSELASITIPYIAQTAESDAALITRVAAEYGAVSKVSGGYWMLLKFGAAKSAGGRELSSITITPDQVSSWNYSEGDRGAASSGSDKKGEAGVDYYNPATGETNTHTTEINASSQRYPYTKPDQESAEKLAESQAKKVQKAGRKMSNAMPCRPQLLRATAECRFITAGFGQREDHHWQAESLAFSLSESGFSLQVSLATDISQKGGAGKKEGTDKKAGENYFSK
ncbi:late control protein [Klebsiella pneumoniae]|nr:late control protein [Klebsiella pneumoniae]